MAKVVAVHGVGQQFKGDAIIHREWWPAFLSGLHLAGHDLPDPNEFVCPFYGHLFRRSGTLAVTDNFQVSDIESEEADWIELFGMQRRRQNLQYPPEQNMPTFRP